jgi:endonuclease/exonuclease/phosphatase family metal-dependent hydrolase
VIVREEPRAVVVGRLDTPAGPITVANTHLSFVPGWNRVQLRHLRRDLVALPGPRMLVGDLNMTPPAPAAVTGFRSLAAACTFPQDEPNRQLDHVLVDDPRIRMTACSAPQMRVSDHRPLIVDLEW